MVSTIDEKGGKAKQRVDWSARVSGRCQAPPEAVYDRVADLRTHPEWNRPERPGAKGMLSMDAPDGPARVDEEFRSTGLEMEGTWRDQSVVTQAERPRLLEYVTTGRAVAKSGRQSAALTAVYRYEMKPAGSGSSVSLSVHITEFAGEMNGMMAVPGLRQIALLMTRWMLRRGLGRPANGQSAVSVFRSVSVETVADSPTSYRCGGGSRDRSALLHRQRAIDNTGPCLTLASRILVDSKRGSGRSYSHRCSVVVRAGRDSLRIRRSGRWHNYSYLDNRRARASRVRGSDRRGDDAQGAKHASVIDATPFGVAHSPGQVRRAHDPWRRGGTNAESYEIGVAFNRFVLTLLPSADQV